MGHAAGQAGKKEKGEKRKAIRRLRR